jgi:hypothetical protein
MLAGAYPLLAVATTFTLMRAWARLAGRLTPLARRAFRTAGAALVAVALPIALVNHTLDAAVGSRTAYAVIDEAMAEAAEAGLSVRYYGNIHASRFLARRNHVEMVYNETSPQIVEGDTRAVLVFEDDRQPTLAALRADPAFDPALYTLASYPHFMRYRPRTVEDPVTADQLRELRQLAYARQSGAVESTAQIWWPRDPQGTFGARHVVQRDAQVFILYYPGSGCVSPKRFAGDTKNYYDILFERAGAVARALAAGDFDAARGVVESALGDGQVGASSIGAGDD